MLFVFLFLFLMILVIYLMSYLFKNHSYKEAQEILKKNKQLTSQTKIPIAAIVSAVSQFENDS